MGECNNDILGVEKNEHICISCIPSHKASREWAVPKEICRPRKKGEIGSMVKYIKHNRK